MNGHVVSLLYHLGADGDNDSDLFRATGTADARALIDFALSVIKSLDSLRLQNIQIFIQLYFSSS
jgi:hypothetical protein